MPTSATNTWALLWQALEVNLNPKWYGVLAEIGAGQEVARWFFRVGAAAGTIAKSISAYDMTISDATYGKADRQVWVVPALPFSPAFYVWLAAHYYNQQPSLACVVCIQTRPKLCLSAGM